MTNTENQREGSGMKLTIIEPTTTITNGDLSVEADEFMVETPKGRFRFYHRADDGLTVAGIGLTIGGITTNSVALHVREATA